MSTRDELIADLDAATRAGDSELASAIDKKIQNLPGFDFGRAIPNAFGELRSAAANLATGPAAAIAGLTDLVSIGAEKLGLSPQQRFSPLVSNLRNQLAGRDDSSRIGPAFAQGLAAGPFAGPPIRDAGLLKTIADIGRNAVIGAGVGAGQGENDKQQLQNAALAAVLGTVVDLGIRAGTTGTKLQPERMRLVSEAKSEGVPLTGAQMTGNRTDLQTEGNFSQIRMFSRGVQRRIDAQENALMRSVSKRLGIDANNLGTEELMRARNVATTNIREPVKGGMFIDPQDAVDLFTVQRNLVTSPRAVEKKSAIGALQDAFDLVGKPIDANKFIEIRSNLNEARTKAFDAGDKFAADQIDRIVKIIESSALKNIPKEAQVQFRTGLRQYANLMTIEDALRKSGSKEGWLGNVSPEKIAPAVERNMPGGMIYDRSSLAPVGRIGSAMKAGQALPETRSYIPGYTELQNTIAYARLNNPLNKAAMENPNARAQAEALLRSIGLGLGAELSE